MDSMVRNWYFHILILLIGLFIVEEMGEIAAKAGFPPNKYLSYLIGGWIIMFNIIPAAMLWGLVLLMALMIIETFNQDADSVKTIFGTLIRLDICTCSSALYGGNQEHQPEYVRIFFNYRSVAIRLGK